MKSPGTIRHKVQQVKYRYLKAALESGLSARPGNCAHNLRLRVPGARGGGGAVGFCGLSRSESGEYEVCDEGYRGREKAESCGLFQLRRSKSDIRREFEESIRNRPLPSLAADYPDLAALLWVLDPPSVASVLADEFVEYRFVPVTVPASGPLSYSFVRGTEVWAGGTPIRV